MCEVDIIDVQEPRKKFSLKLKGKIYFLTNIIYRLHFRNIPIFPEQLMQTKLPILNHQECSAHFNGPIRNDQICTFDSSRRRAPCIGDAGGPLVYEDRLLGILLFRSRVPWGRPDIYFDFNHHDTHAVINFHMNEVRHAN